MTGYDTLAAILITLLIVGYPVHRHHVRLEQARGAER